MAPLPDALARGVDSLLDRTVAPGFSKVGPALRRRLPTWPADPRAGVLAGRTAAVTGASSGLGEATAEGLLRLGASVRLVVRNEDKGAAVADELRASVPGADVHVDRCDLADLDDVRRFAADLGADRLDVLVHNAGTLPGEYSTSPQGHEMTMAVHVLGPVLMTELVGDRLARAGGDARVVFITSGGMFAQKLRADDPDYTEGRDGKYSGTTAYARSKRTQVELLPVLARRWGPGSTVSAMHPGWAATPGVTESLPGFSRLTAPVLRDAAEGADTTVWLAGTQPAPESGLLWHDRRSRPTHLVPWTRTDDSERVRMWQWVQEQAGL